MKRILTRLFASAFIAACLLDASPADGYITAVGFWLFCGDPAWSTGPWCRNTAPRYAVFANDQDPATVGYAWRVDADGELGHVYLSGYTPKNSYGGGAVILLDEVGYLSHPTVNVEAVQ